MKMFVPKIISSGSQGNAVLYDSILVDVGVSFNKIRPYVHLITHVLLTHEHGDHLHEKRIASKTIRGMLSINRHIVFIIPDYLVTQYKDEIDALGLNYISFHIKANGSIGRDIIVQPRYGLDVSIEPFDLFHNVHNVGYVLRFMEGDNVCQVVHATDTYSMPDNLNTIDFDYYCIEFNHDEEIIQREIETSKELGEFSHKEKSVINHMSFQRANQWLSRQFINNKLISFYDHAKLQDAYADNQTSIVVPLHVSSQYKEPKDIETIKLVYGGREGA